MRQSEVVAADHLNPARAHHGAHRHLSHGDAKTPTGPTGPTGPTEPTEAAGSSPRE
jgi:hypothetical protein